MFEELVDNLISVKQDFAKNYSGNAHIQEVIPALNSEKFQLIKELIHSKKILNIGMTMII